MPSHVSALVPIESWCFGSPELKATGRLVDIGLLAESLIYYEQVAVDIVTQPHFAALLEWFVRQRRFDTLLSLLRDGTLQIHEFSFLPAPVLNNGVYTLVNIQDELQKQPNSFSQRFLSHAEVKGMLVNDQSLKALERALQDRVIEEKADDYGLAIEEARADFTNPQRHALVVQAFVDELFEFKKLGRPPEIECSIRGAGTRHTVTFNAPYAQLAQIAGPLLNWHAGASIAGAAVNNRLLLSASRLRYDLYLPRPMSTLTGDKLFESARAVQRSGDVIESLKAAVEFPDVRSLVNAGRLDIDAILELRRGAAQFRKWLQSEADRDRDALIAYHNEAARKAGFRTAAPHILNMFGWMAGGAAGSAIGATIAGPFGGAIGGAIGGALSYTIDIGAKMSSAQWRPVVFGTWMRDRISKLDGGKAG